MIGPIKWKPSSKEETKFAISKEASYLNIFITTASIFIISLIFENSARDEDGASLLGLNYSFDYSNDAYWLFWKQDSFDTYSIADGSALAKIIVLVLPPFLISITALLVLLFSKKCCCRARVFRILSTNGLSLQIHIL